MHTAVARYDTSRCFHCHRPIKRNTLMHISGGETFCSTAHARATEHNFQVVAHARAKFERALNRETRRQRRLDVAYRNHQ